jgi:hypothetical protein
LGVLVGGTFLFCRELTFAERAQPAATLVLNSDWELFVDQYLIATQHNVSLQQQTPIRREVVLVTDKPWEGPHSAYFTVFQDHGKVRMYYRGFVPKDGDLSPSQVTCYAESADGIHFTRPNPGLYEFDGAKENNIVYRGLEAHNFTPFLDSNPSVSTESPYKALGGLNGKLFAFKSSDGLHWSKLHPEPVLTEGAFDSQNVAFWDNAAQIYRCYSRGWTKGDYKGYRAVESATSKDFIHWSKSVFNDNQLLDSSPMPPEHFYTSATLPCPEAARFLLSFPKRFEPTRKKFADYSQPGVSDAVFLTSRNGTTWTRLSREAWLRPGPDPHNWTQRSNMPAWSIVQLEPDEFSLYVSEHYGWPDNRLRRVTVRRHGFCAMHGGADSGEFTTKPVQLSGNRLVLNYATSAAGSVQVELLNEDNHALPGFGLDDFTPLFGDELDAVVRWKQKTDLGDLKGKPVRLRFVLKDADLFALRTLN